MGIARPGAIIFPIWDFAPRGVAVIGASEREGRVLVTRDIQFKQASRSAPMASERRVDWGRRGTADLGWRGTEAAKRGRL